MSRIIEYINNIIEGKCMCILCLKEISNDCVDIYDETCTKYNEYLTIKELINYILGDEFQGDLMCDFMSTVCMECTKAAIDCYTFMEMCRNSHLEINRMIDKITTSLDNSTDLYEVKTVYVSIKNSDFDCNIKCDARKKPKNIHKALKRFKFLMKRKKKKKVNIKLEDCNYDIASPEMIEIMSENEGNTFTCKECLKIFRRSTNLRSHYLRVHAPKDFKCPECTSKFGSAYLLKLHRSECHVKGMCASCGKTYDNLHSLKMHMDSHLEKVCPTCGKHYKSRNSFKRHIKLQACGHQINSNESHNTNTIPDYRYECDICKKRFTQKGSLRVHINFEHENGKAYTCNWCKKKFSAQSKLKAHIVKHTRERNFTCEICGGKFVTKEAVLYHTRIHTGEKPYPCPQCDEKFLSASRRTEHLRRKHWGPTFECDICPSRFKTAFCLKKHKLRHFDPNSRLYTENCLLKVMGI